MLLPLRVLVTGFGPFQDVIHNPSWLAVSPLNNQTLTFSHQPSPGHPHAPRPQPVQVEAHVTAVEVPVTYSAVLNTIPPLYASKKYDIMLHVGVTSFETLKIERQARKTGYEFPDANDQMCDLISAESEERGFGQGYEQFGEVIRTEVDVDGVVKHLKLKGLEHIRPSDDAELFLCEFIYYSSLAHAQRDGGRVKVLFMHVPSEGQPYQIEDMTRAVTRIIEYFALNAST